MACPTGYIAGEARRGRERLIHPSHARTHPRRGIQGSDNFFIGGIMTWTIGLTLTVAL